MNRRSRLQVLALVLLCGCDSVGRALVENSEHGGGGDLACEATACEPITMPEVVPAPDDTGIDSTCPAPDPRTCEPVIETEPSFETADLCRQRFSLDDDSFDPAALRQFSCASVKLVRSEPAHDGPLRLDGVLWAQSDVVVESSHELSLELHEAALDRLRVTLRGPVTLRVIDSRELSSIRLTAHAPDARVDLHQSSVRKVFVGDAQPRFAGVFSSTRSTLSGLDVFAREVRLETAGLYDSRIDADRLELIDVRANISALTAAAAVVSASSLNYAEVSRCGSLSLYNTTFNNFRIVACDQPTRVFNTTLSRGTLDGEVLGDSAGFNRTTFGLHQPTDLKLWDGTINSSNFCANTDRVVLAGRVTGSCADCGELDGSDVPVDACKHEDSTPLFLKSCKALEEMDDCRPTPTRMRPPLK